MPRPDGVAIEVLVVDADDGFRRLVSELLVAEGDFDVVGEASAGSTGLAAAQDLLPDIVLLAVRMPDSGGIKTAWALRDLVPTTKVVMLTVGDEEDDLYEALCAGANGYLLKDGFLEDIGTSLRTICAGQTVLSKTVAARLAADFGRADSPARLSEREVEVLQLVAEGEENRAIAERLRVSLHTVKRHIANILAKLHQRSRLDAAAYATDHNLLH